MQGLVKVRVYGFGLRVGGLGAFFKHHRLWPRMNIAVSIALLPRRI